jgi:acyl dehydratase
MTEGTVLRQHYHVSPTVFEGFRDVFRDLNPMHTDEAFARSHGFRGRVMYGNILNGFLSHFVGECLPQKNVVIQTQSIQYARPVFLDDKLELVAEVSGFFESVNAVEFKYYFQNEQGEKVARGKLQIGIL